MLGTAEATTLAAPEAQALEQTAVAPRPLLHHHLHRLQEFWDKCVAGDECGLFLSISRGRSFQTGRKGLDMGWGGRGMGVDGVSGCRG